LSDDNFEFDYNVDSNGILIISFAGYFDADDWLVQMQEKLQSAPKSFNPERPMVVDLTNFKPPKSDWSIEIQKVLSLIKARGLRRGRRALVIGENTEAQIAGHFYTRFKEATMGVDEGLRIFVSHEEAYAWVSEGWTNALPMD